MVLNPTPVSRPQPHPYPFGKTPDETSFNDIVTRDLFLPEHRSLFLSLSEELEEGARHEAGVW